VTLPRTTVLYATDANFWGHTYVSLHSLLVNNRDIPFDVRILSSSSDAQFFERVPALQDAHGNVEITWLPVDDTLFASAPLKFSYITRTTYYRLAIDQLLPDSVERVLYLDGDTIVRDSLRKLLTFDIDDYVLAATPEYVSPSNLPQPRFVPHPPRMGWPAHTPYFNAGVLYINMNMWRQQNIYEQCLEYYQANADHPSKLDFQDQDILNAVLVGKWKRVGPAFNFAPWAMDPQRFSDPGPRPLIGNDIPQIGPAIVHYTGTIKPWHGGCPHPYEADYWHYRMATPYADHLMLTRSKLMGFWRKSVRRPMLNVVRRMPYGHEALRVAKTRLTRV